MKDQPPVTIVIVDDTLSCRSPLATFLREEGFDVEEVTSESKLQHQILGRPHLVIRDVQVLDWNSLDVRSRLKSTSANSSSLELHLFGPPMSIEEREQTRKASTDNDLIQVVQPSEQLAFVKALLRLHREEAALHANEAMLRPILEHAPVVVVIKDAQGRYLLVNHLWEKLFHLPRADVLGRTLHDIFPQDCADVIRANDVQVLEARGPLEFEEVIPLDDGPHTYLSVKFPLCDEKGEPYAVCAVSTEITKRKRTEEALRQAEERYRGLFENAVEGVYQTTTSGRFLTANPALARMLGFASPEELLTGVADISHQLHVEPERREAFRQLVEERGVVRGFECQLRRQNGSVLWTSLSGRAMRDREGRVVYFQGMVADISERKEAERQLQFRVRQQAIIAELGQRALASLDVSALLGEAAVLVAEVLEVEHCLVLELLPDGKTLHLRAASGLEEGEMGQAVVRASTESQASYTLLCHGPVIVEDLSTESRFAVTDRAAGSGVVSSMSVILPGTCGPFGVLTAETTRRRTFLADDVHFLQAVANVLATALERKRAEDVLLANQIELDLARKIQQKLFPITVPRLAGLNICDVSFGFDVGGASFPAEAIGGDYYDYVSLPDGGLGVAIGDVSGHGIGPALLMAELRAYLRAFAQTQSDAGAILGLINRVLATDIADDRFITLLLACLDPRTLTFRYASAGHPTAYVLDGAGFVKRKLPSTNIPLGIFPDEEFVASAAIVLEPGDLVVFVTDGVVEARSPEGVAFGTQRTLDLVRVYRKSSARLIVDNLYHAVRAFCQNEPQYDDITATVIKIGERTSA